MQTEQIRRAFLKYFKERGHTVVPSSAVFPHDDPTLLFTNAGMNQFKDVFLGKTQRDYSRAATSQKCIRVGGKHNDLDNVGHTSRHLTFFEMLGNFSFGDYFKKEAIQFAWEVTTQVFGFDPERVWPTVYQDDDEAFELWTAYVPAKRITRFGEKENFWAMGDTGPCGPSSELLYDRGEKYGSGRMPSEDPAGERFLEFWNLVFMQYNRFPGGAVEPLPKPSIDTGSGLERVVNLKMGCESVFETDVLRDLIAGVETLSGVSYHPEDHARGSAFRVIADHLRCLSFAIADGVQPSNVDRGYVLRKVLRRAVRYGKMLGFEKPFLAALYPRLEASMGRDYPELVQAHGRIEEILTTEEEAFFRTLRRGGNILNQVIERAQTAGQLISGDDAFKLKDTYGLPVEEILLIARDGNLTVDLNRYHTLEEESKERSRSSRKADSQLASENIFGAFVEKEGESRFIGYNQHTSLAKVAALTVNGQFVERLEEGQEGMVILDQTPFYAEMGGQVGDTGLLRGEHVHFKVTGCQAPYKGVIAHLGKLESGALRLGDTVVAEIDEARRQKIASNHTATHLLHWALHLVLGEHVKQAGSVVDEARLRFDFSHHKPLTTVEVQRIEDLVNERVRENRPVTWYEIPYEEAQGCAAIKQFFGEKYGKEVRVVDIDFSKELCGGTHTTYLGTIGLFRIVRESGIAAGVRRIEAETGAAAEKYARQAEAQIDKLASLLKAQPAQVIERVEKLLEEGKQQALELKELKKKELLVLVNALILEKRDVQGIPFFAGKLNVSMEDLRIIADEAASRIGSGVLAVAAGAGERCQLIVRVTDDLVAKGTSAHELVKKAAVVLEGSGGGKPGQAQAGGKAVDKMMEALGVIEAALGG